MRIGSARILLLAAASSFAGCQLEEGGGGPGGGTFNFVRGYAFVRDDQVQVANAADYQIPEAISEAGAMARQPSLSADGAQVVWVEMNGATHSIRAASSRGGTAPRTLYTAQGGEHDFRTPVFSPDRTRVAFAYADAANVSRLAWVKADGTGGFTTVTPGTESYASPSFYSGGSDLLAMVGTAPGYDRLEKLNIDTGAVVIIATSLGGDASAIVNRVVLSPDELSAAFNARLVSNPSVSRIFSRDISSAGGLTTQLSDHVGADALAQDTFPTWRSDARAGFTSNAGGPDALYEIDLSSAGNPGTLTVGSAREGFFGPPQ